MGAYEIDCIQSNLERGVRPEEEQQDVARKIPPSPYHEKMIKPQLQHSPWLESLAHFMDPDAKDFAMDRVNNHRMNLFDIKVIHISKSRKPNSIIKCSSTQDFEIAMKEDERLAGDRVGTIIIAKGISRAMIEALGSRFGVEPDFFADYLHGTELYRMGLQQPQPPERAQNFILRYTRTAPFYSTEFRRAYHIVGCIWKMLVQLRTTNTTTPRGINFVHENLPDMFGSEKISVYKRKGSRIGKCEFVTSRVLI